MNFITCAMKNAKKKDWKEFARYGYKFLGAGLTPDDQYLDAIPEAKPFVDKARKAYFGQETKWSHDKLSEAVSLLKKFPGDRADLTEIMEGRVRPTPEQKPFLDKISASMDKTLQEAGYQSQGNKLSDKLEPLRLGKAQGKQDRLSHLFEGNDLKHASFDRIYKRFIDATARDKFRKPIHQEIKTFLSSPQGKAMNSTDKFMLKNFSEQYGGVKTDENPLLGTWKRIDAQLAKQVSRSYLGFDPHLQMLHAARYVAFGIPRIGPLNTIKSLANVTLDPMGSYKRAVNAGLVDYLPHNRYKEGMDKADILTNFADAGNVAAKILTHEGMRAKYPGDETRAAYETAKAEMMPNPTSHQPIALQGTSLITQFKGFTARASANITQDMYKAFYTEHTEGFKRLGSYLLAGAGLSLAGRAIGADFSHYKGPLGLLSITTPQARSMANIGQWLSNPTKTDRNGTPYYEKALTEMARYFTAGHSLIKKDTDGKMNIKYPGEEMLNEIKKPPS